MPEIEFALAGPGEKEPVKELLSECGLPYEDIGDHLHNFIVAQNSKRPVGVIGLEAYGKFGLLRSLAVAKSFRGKGVGKALHTRMLGHAYLQGIRALYLLTTSAEGFFSKLGFQAEERDNIPEPIRMTKEFQTFCPLTAVCMAKEIGGEAQYFPREVLTLQPDVPGSRMWGVALEKTMFTYFEVEPHCCFEMHRHESEQITMVLEGELFFEAGGRIIGVKEGEVIALPSDLPHAAFTREKAVRAVDAWSPVMERFIK